MVKKNVVVFVPGDVTSSVLDGQADWDFLAELSEEGKMQARSAAQIHRGFLQDCDRFAVAPIISAQQTLLEMMIDLGLQITWINFCDELWTKQPARYHRAKGVTVAEWAKANERVAHDEGEDMLNDIACMVNYRSTGIFCVVPRGPADCLLAYAKAVVKPRFDVASIRDLRGGEGFVLSFDDLSLVGVQVLRTV